MDTIDFVMGLFMLVGVFVLVIIFSEADDNDL